LLRNTLPGNGGPFDIFDELLARAFACSSCLSHLPLPSGYDEPRTLSYQITLFGPINADVRHDDFEAEWGRKYPSITPSGRRTWQEVISVFAFPPAVLKIIYSTNAIESLNRVIRKTTKTRGSCPTDDAATKPIYLAIRSFEKAGRCLREWVAARNQFAILDPERSNR
jgi:hypothetical protein